MYRDEDLELSEAKVVIRLNGRDLDWFWVKIRSSKAMFKEARDKFLANWDIPEADKKIIRKYLKVVCYELQPNKE